MSFREAVGLALAVVAFGLLLSASATQGASPEASRVVRLTFEPRSESATVDSGWIVAKALTTVAEAPQPVVRPLAKTLSGELTIELDPEWSWRVEVQAPGFWSVPAVVGSQDREARIEVLPTAPIEVRAEAPRGREPPSSLTIEVRPAPGEQAFPVARIECPVAEALWRCEVPAGRIDVKIAALDYVPVYRWGLSLERGKPHPIDAGELRTGASVSGFVEATDGAAEGARVRLAPVLLLPESEDREQALAAEAAVNDRGFFLLAGIAPGEYVVSAREEGYATARSEPLRVEEDAETQLLTPLRLERPVELEVFVSPPVDPFSEPWQVEAEREDRTSRRSHPAPRHPASDAGSWVLPGLEPARYVLRVFDSRGSIVTQREVDVTNTSPPVELEVDVVPVQGQLRLGEEPLEAHLTFSGIRGGERMRRVRRGLVMEGGVAGGQPEGEVTTPDFRHVRLDSDAQGRLEGYVPHEGFWEVEIATAFGMQVRLPDPIEVLRPEDGGPAEVDIVVPDTRLEVRVLDPTGRPVAGAALMLVDPQTGVPSARAETDAEGIASFKGLPERPVLVEARGREGVRAGVRVEPRSGEETRVELVLEPTLRVEGVVTSVHGSVPGALLELRPAGVGIPGWTTTTTRASGWFRVSVPAGTSAVEVIVLAPGLPLRLARLPIEPSEEGRARMDVHLEDAGGILRLDFEKGMDPTVVQLAHGGAVVELMSLLGALVSTPAHFNQDGDIALPLQPGAYTVCSPAPDCQRVFVSPGASSELVLGDGETGSGGN